MKKLIVMLVVLWSVGAVAKFTGSDLLALCLGTGKGEPNADAAKYSSCVQFLGNASDPPTWASDEKLRQVYLIYARKYPKELSWDAGTVTINAFDDFFPARRD